MFFVCGMQQRLPLVLVVIALAALLVSGCGGDGASQEEDSAEDTATTTEDTDQATTTTGDTGQAPEDALNAALGQSFSESGAPGVVAAVQTPDYTWVETRGVADRTSEEPITPDVHQRIGSVNKTFTVSLLLQAEADGLLSLDDTIDQYYEGIPNGDEITLRQMANMTSGIASYTFNEQFRDALLSDPQRVWTPEELVQFAIDDSPAFDPGTEFQYSNTNTVLLGLVLQQVTGRPIGDLYREQIIEPLGLQETSFPELEDSSLPDPQARGYTLQGQSGGEPVDITNLNPSWGWTAGAMISTMDDLLVYGRALGTGEGLLPPEQQAERLDSFLGGDIPPNTADRAYGFGIGREYGWLGHTGTLPGYNTTVYYSPELDATVVVETNSDISSGDCSDDNPTLADSPHDIPCEEPAKRIFGALAEALGQPFGTDQ
jgi:D-alanyl-D-alanine carboxypeptidase